MRLAVTILGLDLFTVEITTDTTDTEDDYGDCTTTAIGFAPSPGDQRWQLADVPELS